MRQQIIADHPVFHGFPIFFYLVGWVGPVKPCMPCEVLDRQTGYKSLVKLQRWFQKASHRLPETRTPMKHGKTCGGCLSDDRMFIITGLPVRFGQIWSDLQGFKIFQFKVILSYFMFRWILTDSPFYRHAAVCDTSGPISMICCYAPDYHRVGTSPPKNLNQDLQSPELIVIMRLSCLKV